MSKLTNTFDEIDETLVQQSNKSAVIYCGIDSLTAGEDDGATGFNYIKWMQKYLNGAAGFGGVYVPFASFVQFTPQYFDNYFATIAEFGGARQWVDSLPFTDERKINSVNGLGAYFDGTQSPTGVGFRVYIEIPYRKLRLFYRQHPGGGVFDIDRPDYGETITGIDTSGVESIQHVDIDLNRTDTPNNPGTGDNAGYNLRMNNVSGEVQFHGVLILTGNGGPVVVSPARQGRKTSDAALTSRQVRIDFLQQCGVTHSFVNAGTNDTGTSTPTEFEADLNELISAQVEAGVRPTVVIPNTDSAGSQLQFDQAYRNVATNNDAELFDIPSEFGDYAKFSANGWMLDTTHPNDFFYQWLGQVYAKKLVGPVKLEDIDVLI